MNGFTMLGHFIRTTYSLASAIPPWVIANVASFSGRSGLKKIVLMIIPSLKVVKVNAVFSVSIKY